MVDNLSPEERSRLMSRVRGKDTKPEMIVRKSHTAWATALDCTGAIFPAAPIWFFRDDRRLYSCTGVIGIVTTARRQPRPKRTRNSGKRSLTLT